MKKRPKDAEDVILFEGRQATIANERNTRTEQVTVVFNSTDLAAAIVQIGTDKCHARVTPEQGANLNYEIDELQLRLETLEEQEIVGKQLIYAGTKLMKNADLALIHIVDFVTASYNDDDDNEEDDTTIMKSEDIILEGFYSPEHEQGEVTDITNGLVKAEDFFDLLDEAEYEDNSNVARDIARLVNKKFKEKQKGEKENDD